MLSTQLEAVPHCGSSCAAGQRPWNKQSFVAAGRRAGCTARECGTAPAAAGCPYPESQIERMQPTPTLQRDGVWVLWRQRPDLCRQRGSSAGPACPPRWRRPGRSGARRGWRRCRGPGHPGRSGWRWRRQRHPGRSWPCAARGLPAARGGLSPSRRSHRDRFKCSRRHASPSPGL
jgi:hypothetical protein